MSKTDTCTKCGQTGHTASSCKRAQCVACESFRMTKGRHIHRCLKFGAVWSPSPTCWRQCNYFRQAPADTEEKRRETLRAAGSIVA